MHTKPSARCCKQQAQPHAIWAPRGVLAAEGALVVNDMEPGFEASKDPLTQWFVEQEIIKARAAGKVIIVVEYDPHETGETYQRLMQHLEGYDRLVMVNKSDDDGSEAILAQLASKNIWVEDFRFCGVNSDACIKATIEGLLQCIPTSRVTVVQDACNSTNDRDCDVWHNVFPLMKNVTVEMHCPRH